MCGRVLWGFSVPGIRTRGDCFSCWVVAYWRLGRESSGGNSVGCGRRKGAGEYECRGAQVQVGEYQEEMMAVDRVIVAEMVTRWLDCTIIAIRDELTALVKEREIVELEDSTAGDRKSI